jgi:hypothetical protein
MPQVFPDLKGDFLLERDANPDQFDAVHHLKALEFWFFDHEGHRVFTCRSFDIVAHEMGHAILDSIRPGYLTSTHPQTGGLHEAFGDLSAIFTMLAQLDQCEAIVAESRLNLHDRSFFNVVGEQFGQALGREHGLRNADNDLKLSDVGTSVHALSQVFTGGVYDSLADMFDDHLDLDRYDPAETLFRVGQHMASVLLVALLNAPDKDASYADIVNKMIEIEPVAEWKEFIRSNFEKREVLGPIGFAPATQLVSELDLGGCCGTLSSEEYRKELDSN